MFFTHNQYLVASPGSGHISRNLQLTWKLETVVGTRILPHAARPVQLSGPAAPFKKAICAPHLHLSQYSAQH